MIRALVDFALNNKFVVLATALLLLGWGVVSFHNLPVEAYPDIGDNYVTVITQWAGRSAEEVEQQVTIPIEIQMAGMPHMTFLRSESIFGLSFVIMIFDDTSVNDWNRQKVMERLTQVNLPPGQNLQPQIGTDWSTTGQIYWYTLRSTNPKRPTTQSPAPLAPRANCRRRVQGAFGWKTAHWRDPDSRPRSRMSRPLPCSSLQR